MAEQVSKEISRILENAFGDKIENFEVQVQEGNKKGEGFLGELLYISIRNKNTNADYHLAIKEAIPIQEVNSRDFMIASYNNEINFYTQVLPAFYQLQNSFSLENFVNVPKCYATASEKGKEKVVLENLKFKNYQLHPKSVPLTFNMYEKIFQLYGKYHALSFALKEIHPETFSNLTSGLRNNWLQFADKPIVQKGVNNLEKRITTILQNWHEDELIKRFQNFVSDGITKYKKAVEYEDSYGVILHGDAWSNNMMFKYDDSRGVEDIKLLDFQLAYTGSPTHDLCYSLYSGASKEALDKIDILLEIYHSSLDYNLKRYHLKAEKIYPMDVLRREWKKYCPFGYIMGSLIWTVKNTEVKLIVGLTTDDENKIKNHNPDVNHENYDEPVINLIRHMCENGFM